MKSFSALLFLMFVCKSFAQEDVIFGQSRQGNVITFTCESFRGQGEEIIIRVVSADSSNCTELDLPMTRPIPVTSAMARFIVTPSAEKAAYCEVGDVSTDKVYFGASPVLEPTVRRLLAIVGSEHTLECPYELGTASDHINPYHHIWFNTDESNDAILGEFSRTLTVNISEMSPDVTTYTCALRMRECSRCRTEVNYPPLNTPQFKITKVADQEDVISDQSRQGNDISFTCSSNIGQGEDIKIQVISTDSLNSTALSVNVSRYFNTTTALTTFTISDDKAAYCEVGDMSTHRVTYFGASPHLETNVTRLLAIVGSEHTLECPYELGTASDHISPYHHIWFNTDDSNVAIPEEFNRILNAFITRQSPDVSTYTCALRMRECSVCARVVEYPPLNRPQFQITKIVPLSIDVALVSQTVSAGSPVTFECAANGTSIEIIWMYDGDTYTADDANVNTSQIDSAYVQSILELSSPSSSGSVICIVRQLFNGTIMLDNNDFDNNLPDHNTSSTAQLIVTDTSGTIIGSVIGGTGIFLIIFLACLLVGVQLHHHWHKRKQVKAKQTATTVLRHDLDVLPINSSLLTPSNDMQESTLSTDEANSTELPPETVPTAGQPSTDINDSREESTANETPTGTGKASTAGKSVEEVSSAIANAWSLILGNVMKLPDLSESLKIPGSQLKLSSDPIGQGETGVVYKGLLMNWKDEPLQAVAVKTLKGLFSSTDIQFLISEIIKMKDFNHPHVMPLIGVCLDAGPGVSMVMPHMTNGSVLDYLKKERSSLKLPGNCSKEKAQSVRKLLLRMCHQIALGMEYLSQQRFIHRDLAARNCMLDSSGDVRVGDFGLAEDVYSTGYFRQNDRADIKLPYKWMALESLNDAIFTEKTDVWSYGVTMWEVFSGGQIPYPGVDVGTLVKFLQRGSRLDAPVNTACTTEISAVMQRCWLEDCEERPSFTDLSSIMDAMLSSVSDTTELNMELPHNSQDTIDMSGYDDLNEALRNRATRTD